MTRTKQNFLLIIISLSLLFFFFPIQVIAASQQYTVTYRAGNVGTYSTAGWTAQLNAAGYTDIEVTENYIKIKLNKGDTIPRFSNAVWVQNTIIADNQKYFVLDVGKWGPSTGIVTKNTEYVTDYGVLIDPVKYTIAFRDSDSSEEVTTPIIGYGNEGDILSVTPVSITGYASSATPTTLVLSKNQENVVTFVYTSTYDPGTETSTVTTTVDGETVTVTTAGDVVTNTVTLPGTVTTGTGTTGTTPAAPAAGAEPGAAATDGTTTIDDGQTPLAGGESEEASEDESTVIEDEETPLAGETSPNSYLIPIITGVILALIIGLLIVWSRMKTKKASGIDNKDDLT